MNVTRFKHNLQLISESLASDLTQHSIVADKLDEVIQLPDDAELAMRLIKAGESERVEFKEALAWDNRTQRENKGITRKALEAVVGLRNAQGGYLLIGVANSGTVVGLDAEIHSLHKTRDELLLYWKNMLRDYVSSVTGVTYRLVRVEGKLILQVQCKAATKAVFLREVFHVRQGPSTERLEGKRLWEYCQDRFLPEHHV